MRCSATQRAASNGDKYNLSTRCESHRFTCKSMAIRLSFKQTDTADSKEVVSPHGREHCPPLVHVKVYNALVHTPHCAVSLLASAAPRTLRRSSHAASTRTVTSNSSAQLNRLSPALSVLPPVSFPLVSCVCRLFSSLAMSDSSDISSLFVHHQVTPDVVPQAPPRKLTVRPHCKRTQLSVAASPPVELSTHCPRPAAVSCVFQLVYDDGSTVEGGNEMLIPNTQKDPTVSFPTTAGQYYSLLMIDPDNFSRDKPTFRQFIHWFVINIPGVAGGQGVNVNNGFVVSPYMVRNARQQTLSLIRSVCFDIALTILLSSACCLCFVTGLRSGRRQWTPPLRVSVLSTAGSDPDREHQGAGAAEAVGAGSQP